MHRPDKNQSPLVDVFEQLGGFWIPYASKPFDGWAWHPKWVLRQPYFKPLMGGYAPVEIKDPKRKNHANRYTQRQIKIMDEMTKRGAVWLEWETEEDVWKSCGARRAA
jgi:hypothetical protein